MHGLTEHEAAERLQVYGKNILLLNQGRRLPFIIFNVIKEPMFLLLASASILYLVIGEPAEGWMMIGALCFVAAISVYQEVATSHAIEALKDLTEPRTTVIRDDKEKNIAIEWLVPGDVIMLTEGEKVPAEAIVNECNDLTVNESILTGESFPVSKDNVSQNQLYQGTVINSGKCIATVTSTGAATSLGKIGKSIITYTETQTDLQRKANHLVKILALFGAVAFIVIFLVNYVHTGALITSLLFGLTLAMSAIPEEIPVAFSSFMALGAHAMSRLGIISRQPHTIENLGAVNVICLDKTGTITANKMTVSELFSLEAGPGQEKTPDRDILYHAYLASEESPFDAMEKAIEEAFLATGDERKRVSMAREFALEGKPPMMTHVYAQGDGYLAAAKGAVERIVSVCQLNNEQVAIISRQANAMAIKGYRVLAVASAIHPDNTFPGTQDEFQWTFTGLLALYDPPKDFIHDVFEQFYKAGIAVKLLTGDYLPTAQTIAAQVGLITNGAGMSGDDVMTCTEVALRKIVHDTNLFTRMYPDAKLKVVNALKAEGFIVAMTGDGVNDGPALKAADVGIALGKAGTEVARQSADLILTDDDIRKLPQAIEYGRKIFSNFKKAVRYIISIHIPIILVASLPLLLGWKYPNIYTPVHVIFLELIMGPTCSIFYEREPAEAGLMLKPPRQKLRSWFTGHELFISIIQGIVIALGILVLYYGYTKKGASIEEVRTVVFTTLILSNIFLTFSDRSFEHTINKTLRYKNNLVLPVLLAPTCFLVLLLFVPFVQKIFGLQLISLHTFLICLLTAFMGVGWFEILKSTYRLPRS